MNSKIINIQEAKELVEKYRSITKEMLQPIWDDAAKKNAANKEEDDIEYIYADEILNKITGFSQRESCSLCKPVKHYGLNKLSSYCRGCIYAELLDNGNPNPWVTCTDYESKETYKAVERASSIEQLLLAISNRADYLESLIPKAEEFNANFIGVDRTNP